MSHSDTLHSSDATFERDVLKSEKVASPQLAKA